MWNAWQSKTAYESDASDQVYNDSPPDLSKTPAANLEGSLEISDEIEVESLFQIDEL